MQNRGRLGLKGARAQEWLAANGVIAPAAANSWTLSEAGAGTEGATDALLVARLGTSEFFVEGAASAPAMVKMSRLLDSASPGVYPVTREDWGFELGGEQVHEVLAQVCDVNFAALRLDAHPLVMTLMIGVAVLVVPLGGLQYRMWCDPTFGPYLSESLGAVVIECGGSYTGDRG